MIRCTLSLIAAFFLLSVCAVAQTEDRDDGLQPAPEPIFGDLFSWGVSGSLNFTSHYTDFPASPAEPDFADGSGTTFSVGAFADIPLSSLFALQCRVGYHNHNTTLSAEEDAGVSMINDELVLILVGHTRNVSLSSLAIEPLLRFRLTRALSLLAGGRAGLVLVSDYEHREEILYPADFVFQDTGSPVRTASGDLPDAASVEAAFVGGVGYAFPLRDIFSGSDLFLIPEITYSLGLTDVVKTSSWSVHSVRLGLSLAYMQY